MSRIPLRSFDLLHPIAEGGMGAVWEARHRGTGDAVAIKVLTRKGVHDPKVVEALLAEVAAMACLDHPHVVGIHDTGVISSRAASLSADVLPKDSPWYAMELVKGGTLADRRWVPDYAAIQRVLLALLDALSHAHAHGIVHRDLKPRNVLMGGQVADPIIKLTDFGLAFARGKWLSHETDRPGVAGTPTYLAPELLLDDPSALGPWTDLYAAGCIAWSLACGRRPYRPNDIKAQVRAHRVAPIPELRARIPLPPGFDAWVYRMMAKRPADRFQTAAAAARALASIQGSDPGPVPLVSRVPKTRPRLPGTGVSLLPMRTPILRGRYDAQAAIDAALGTVERTSTSQVVVLRGPAGVGRTALGDWACRRATETGRALPVRVTHTGGQVDGLAGALCRGLGLRGDTAERGWRDRLRQLWPDDPGFEDDLPRVWAMVKGSGLTGPDRMALTARTIDRLRGERPVLLWIDDALLGAEALQFVHGLIQRRAFPTLVLLAVRDDRAPDCPREEALVRGLASTSLALAPLSDRDLDHVILDALAIDTAGRARLLARAGGNPGFLLEMLRDHASRGGVRLGPTSAFVLAGDIELPDSFTQLWQARVSSLLEGHDRWRRPLFAAAALGLRVDVAEWAAVCARMGHKAPADLILSLMRKRLVVRDPGSRLDEGFQFAHAMLREAILSLAADAGDLAPTHQACAVALADLPGIWRDRIGTHRFAGGDRDGAIDDLVEGAWQRTFRGDLLGAAMIADDVEQWLPDDDPRMGRVLQIRVRASRMRGDHDETLLRLRRQLRWARSTGDPATWSRALRQRAVIRLHQGDFDGAETDALAASEALKDRGSAERLEALAWLGLVRARCRKFTEATEALDAAEALGTHYLVLYGRGVMTLDLDDAAGAVPYLRRAVAEAAQLNDPLNAAQFSLVLAQALRLVGEHDEAHAMASTALEQLEGWQAHWSSEARVCLALCELARGDEPRAAALLDAELGAGTDEDAEVIATAMLVALRARTGHGKTPAGPGGPGPTLSRAYELEVAALLRDSAQLAMALGRSSDAELAEAWADDLAQRASESPHRQ